MDRNKSTNMSHVFVDFFSFKFNITGFVINIKCVSPFFEQFITTSHGDFSRQTQYKYAYNLGIGFLDKIVSSTTFSEIS